jgi:hypothetical protein
MKTTTLDKLIWALIYGGLLGIGLGLAVQRSDEMLGWGFVGFGGAVAVVGAVLVFVRSRMKDNP